MNDARTNTPGILLLTELFPPTVGGSAVLFGEIYSRLRHVPVRVMTERVGARRWGVLHPAGLWHYLRLVPRLRVAARGTGLIHCGRALPEGLAALLSRWAGGPPYACWAHGEEILFARTSRELTWMMRRVYRSAAAVFANSENTRRLLLELGVPADLVQIVYPGVDATRFRPDIDARDLRRRLAADGETLVLSVGRLQARKGHDLAIRAMQAVLPHHPALRYVIVGNGPERARLEALARSCGVSGRVTFVGDVDDELLPLYYAACDIFLLSNREEHGDVEGFGIVFLEASASGKPVIGGRSGGVPEAVLHERTGLLVDGTEVATLAAAITRLVGDHSLRRCFGEAGRTRTCREFTWDRAAAKVLAAHHGLLASP